MRTSGTLSARPAGGERQASRPGAGLSTRPNGPPPRRPGRDCPSIAGYLPGPAAMAVPVSLARACDTSRSLPVRPLAPGYPGGFGAIGLVGIGTEVEVACRRASRSRAAELLPGVGARRAAVLHTAQPDDSTSSSSQKKCEPVFPRLADLINRRRARQLLRGRRDHSAPQTGFSGRTGIMWCSTAPI